MQMRWLLSLLACLAIVIASQQTLAESANNQDNLHLGQDTTNSMVWPMLPNESLKELAAKFYPDNPAMQRKFINKTKQLSQARQQKITENDKSDTLRAIIIPNLSTIPASGGKIKRTTQLKVEKPLQLSYEMLPEEEKEKLAMKFLPAKIIKQYKDLVERNQFLKDELSKLKNRIVFLESKLGELKLILDKTLSFPSKQPIKNLDQDAQTTSGAASQSAETSTKAPQPSKDKKPAKAKPTTVNASEQSSEAQFFNFNNKVLWIALAVLLLFIVLFAVVYKRHRERKYNSMVDLISVEDQQETSYEEEDIELDDLNLASTTINKQTIVEEENDRSVLHEAKVFMKKGQVDDAIEHLKWAIRAKPKASITIWMYLLDVYRKQNDKDAFEKLAFEMHQNFNVMTPVWEERAVAMIVPESLEEFPYIVQFLSEKWPNPKIITYLQKLITDNRSGERAGFSKAVIEEIVLLKDILEIRAPQESNQETT